MISGVNYPWSIYRGRPNYGCDFGRNKWNSHSGVTAHLDEVRADFEGMTAAGFEVARWFVFTDGRGGVDWQTSGELAGVADRFTEDMDAAVDLAGATGVRLCLVLVDFTWLDDPARRAALESTTFIDRVLDRKPAGVCRRRSGPHSFEVARPGYPRRRPRAKRKGVGRSRLRTRLCPSAFISGRSLSRS